MVDKSTAYGEGSCVTRLFQTALQKGMKGICSEPEISISDMIVVAATETARVLFTAYVCVSQTIISRILIEMASVIHSWLSVMVSLSSGPYMCA